MASNLTGSARSTADKSLLSVEERTEAREHRNPSNENGDDGDERRIGQLSRTMCKLNQRIYMLIYDIPSNLNAQCPNPSPILWWYGFRLNKSCWVMPESSLQAEGLKELLAHWATFNLEVHIIPYSEDATEQIRSICRRKLEEELVRIHTSLITRIANAAERLEEARWALDEIENAEEPSCKTIDATLKAKAVIELQKNRARDVRLVIHGSADDLEAAISCAQAFDETDSLETLFSGLRKALRAEVSAFNAKLAVDGVRQMSTPKVALI